MISQDLLWVEVKQYISLMLIECNVDEYDVHVEIQKYRLHTYTAVEITYQSGHKLSARTFQIYFLCIVQPAEQTRHNVLQKCDSQRGE